MGRLRHQRTITAAGLKEEIVDRLGETILHPLAERLSLMIDWAHSPDGTWSSPTSQQILQRVRHILHQLPANQEGRFLFDAMMVKAVAKSLGSPVTTLSDAIIPSYGEDWRMERHPLWPNPDGSMALLELLLIDGENDVEDVVLTEYPWMVHELAHSLLYGCRSLAVSTISDHLRVPLQDLVVGGVSDRGQVKAARATVASRIKSFWTPDDDQTNWADELVCDILGLVVAGPAYGRSLLATTSGIHNPFEMTDTHPPLAARCQALAIAADDLGWSEVGVHLRQRTVAWSQDPKHHGAVSNEYRSATHESLIMAALDAGFQIANRIQLRRCTPGDWERAARKVERGDTPSLGVDLLLAAWHAHDTLSESKLNDWTLQVVRAAIAADQTGTPEIS